jgi:hypothetical protein
MKPTLKMLHQPNVPVERLPITSATTQTNFTSPLQPDYDAVVSVLQSFLGMENQKSVKLLTGR